MRLTLPLVLLAFCLTSTTVLAKPATPRWQAPPSSVFHSNLWSDISERFTLSHQTEQPAVQHYINWWQHHPHTLRQVLMQSAPFIQYIFKQTEERDLPAELALIPFIESHYNPFAYSAAGAVGLWQMMPGTATGQGVKNNWWYDGRRDLIDSTRAALDYLSYLYEFFNQQWLYAIAAYDAGEGNVYHAINRRAKQGQQADFWSLPVPRETQNYIPKLLAICAIIEDPDRYGLVLPEIEDQAYFSIVKLPQQIDLHTAAKLAKAPLLNIRFLNAGFKRWATDPLGPHRLLIPSQHVTEFHQGLEPLLRQPHTPWFHHVVNQGESLSVIAHHYHTSVKLLQQANRLQKAVIHPGQNILVPGTILGHQWQRDRAINASTLSESHVPGPKQITYKIKRVTPGRHCQAPPLDHPLHSLLEPTIGQTYNPVSN